jgi:hypothetical protein
MAALKTGQPASAPARRNRAKSNHIPEGLLIYIDLPLIPAKQMSVRDGERQPQILRLRAAMRRFAQDDRLLVVFY